MTVCVVGAGGREHALALALARTRRRGGHPGQPRHAGRAADGHRITVTPAPARGDRGRPVRDRPRGAAGRRPGRPAAGRGPARGRPGGRRGPARGLEGVHEGDARRGRGADRPLRRLRPGWTRPSRSSRTLPGPWVVKTDGLAAGKGVLVADRRWPRPRPTWWPSSGGAFGDAGRRVVVEEGLAGPECSLLVLCDGRRVVPLAAGPGLQAARRRRPGPNTGGMGAYSPVPERRRRPGRPSWSTSAVEPLVAALRRAGHRLPGRALRRADAHRRRAQGPRVQRPLRGPRDPGGAAAGWADDPVELLMAVAEGRLADLAGDGLAFSDDGRGLRGAGRRRLPGRPPAGRPHRRAGSRRAAGRPGARGDGPPRRHPARRSRTAVPHRRRAGARRHRPGPDPRRGPATGPTRRRGGSAGPACTTAATSPSRRPPRSAPAEGRGDPALQPARHGRPLHRRGPPGPLARGGAAGGRGAGRGRAWCRPPTPRPSGPGRPKVDAAFVAEVERAGAGHRPRRGRLRRRRPGAHRPARGVVDPLRAHLVRRGRHRPVRHPGRAPPTCCWRPPTSWWRRCAAGPRS